jgi:hypothetical protein
MTAWETLTNIIKEIKSLSPRYYEVSIDVDGAAEEEIHQRLNIASYGSLIHRTELYLNSFIYEPSWKVKLYVFYDVKGEILYDLINTFKPSFITIEDEYFVLEKEIKIGD